MRKGTNIEALIQTARTMLIAGLIVTIAMLAFIAAVKTGNDRVENHIQQTEVTP